MRRALQWSFSTGSAETSSRLGRILLNEAVASTFRQLILQNSKLAYDECGFQKKGGFSIAMIERLVDPSLDSLETDSTRHAPSSLPGLTNDGLETRIVKVVQSANDLSLPFCQIQLRLLFGALHGAKDIDDPPDITGFATAFCDQVEHDSNLPSTVLVELVDALADDAAGKVCSTTCTLQKVVPLTGIRSACWRKNAFLVRSLCQPIRRSRKIQYHNNFLRSIGH